MTERDESKQLWFTKDRSAWFLVPNGVDLPEGSFLVRDIRGIKRRTDADFLADYAVSEAEARRAVGDRLDHAWAGVRDAFGQIFGERNPLPEDLDKVLGIDAGRLGTDPGAAKEVASKLGGALKGDLGKALGDLGKALGELGARLADDAKRDEAGGDEE